MSRLTDKLFGTHSEREVKRIRPLVDKIEALRPQMQALSDEELRGKTEEFRKRFQDGETLDTTYLFDDVPEAENSSLMVAPDHTIRCADLFAFDPDGGTVACRLRTARQMESCL